MKLDSQEPYGWWNTDGQSEPWLNTEAIGAGNGWVRIGVLDEVKRRSVWLKFDEEARVWLVRGGREGHDWLYAFPTKTSPFTEILSAMEWHADPSGAEEIK